MSEKIHGSLDDLHLEIDKSEIHEAAREGNIALLQEIVKTNEEACTERDVYTYTPLHWACECGQLEIVHFLVNECHCDVNVIEKRLFKRLPLHLAAMNGHTQIVDFLITKGANVNIQDGQGKSALHYASLNGHCNVISALIAAKCDPTLETYEDGKKAVDIAVQNNHIEVISILKQTCA